MKPLLLAAILAASATGQALLAARPARNLPRRYPPSASCPTVRCCAAPADVRKCCQAVRLAHAGIYRFDAAPPRLRVFIGEAVVPGVGKVSTGHAVSFGSAAVKFNPREFDALQEWNDLRTRQLMDEGGLEGQFTRPRICIP